MSANKPSCSSPSASISLVKALLMVPSIGEGIGKGAVTLQWTIPTFAYAWSYDAHRAIRATSLHLRRNDEPFSCSADRHHQPHRRRRLLARGLQGRALLQAP